MSDKIIVTRKNIKMLYPSGLALSWDGITGSYVKDKIIPKKMKEEKDKFILIQYCNPEDIIELMERKHKNGKSIHNYEKRLAPKWNYMTKRSKELLV